MALLPYKFIFVKFKQFSFSDYLSIIAIIVSLTSAILAHQANRQSRNQWIESRDEKIKCYIVPRKMDAYPVWRRSSKYGTTLSYECTVVNNSDRRIVIDSIIVDPLPDSIMGSLKLGMYVPPPLTPMERNEPPLPLIIEPSGIVKFFHFQEYEMDSFAASILLPLDGSESFTIQSKRSVSIEEIRATIFSRGFDLFGNIGNPKISGSEALVAQSADFSPTRVMRNPRFSIKFTTSRGNEFVFKYSLYSNFPSTD